MALYINVYCPCGMKMTKSTAKNEYDRWMACGSCGGVVDETQTIYHCANKNCYDFCAYCCSSGFPKKRKEDVRYTYDPKPFAQGGCRLAYMGVCLRGPLKGHKIVAKQFMDKTAYQKGDWDLDLKTARKASELVNAWNKLGLVNKKYIFHEGDIRDVKITGGHDSFKLGEFMMFEKYIPGNYEKWNDNNGGVVMKSSSIQAFCHWTYHYSNRTLIMCDAQGVRAYNAYYITDPAIHSIWQGYGDTDWGKEGIVKFFETHVCNEFCDSKWSTFNSKKKQAKLPKSTSYRWKTGKAKTY